MSKMLTLLALLVVAAPVSAQSQPKTFCFRSAPASTCRSYLLFEVRGQLPVLYTERMVETYGMQIDREGAVDEFRRSDARRMMEGTLGWDLGLATRIHVWEAVLGVRYDVMNVPGQVTTWSGIGNENLYTKTDPGGVEHSLSIGAAFEGLSALVLTLATLAAVATIPIS